MSFLSNLIKDVAVPAVLGFATGGPAGAFAGAVVADKQKKAQEKAIRQQEQQIMQRNKQMAEIFGSGTNLSSIQAPQAGYTTANAGFGAGFGSFLGDVGRNIVSPCLLYTSPSPRDGLLSRMPSSA